LTLATLRDVWATPRKFTLDAAARSGVDALRGDRCASRRRASHVYGVNTGFGLLARTRIDDARLAELQRALLLSHFGRDRPRPRRRGRAARARAEGVLVGTRALGRALGARRRRSSRSRTADVLPRVPMQGSVGASGDLAPSRTFPAC
jgi:histidine ammonia-lyase